MPRSIIGAHIGTRLEPNFSAYIKTGDAQGLCVNDLAAAFHRCAMSGLPRRIIDTSPDFDLTSFMVSTINRAAFIGFSFGRSPLGKGSCAV